MTQKEGSWKIVAAIGIAITLWSGNNIATKIVITEWPPMWATGIRFAICSSILLLMARFIPALGPRRPIDAALRKQLWIGPGLGFTAYLLSFVWALRLTTASNVAVYFATSPVFAMLWDRYDGQRIAWKRMMLASGLTFIGVIWLFLPTLSKTSGAWIGDALSLLGSLLWVNFSYLSRKYQDRLSACQLNGEIFWRTALLISPFALYDHFTQTITLNSKVLIAYTYAVLGPSVVAFLAWSYALKRWPTSKVMLFVNLIPLLTAFWAWLLLDESIPTQFWIATLLVGSGVSLSLGKPPNTR